FVWKQNYILVDEYFFFCCTWIVNSAGKYDYAFYLAGAIAIVSSLLVFVFVKSKGFKANESQSCVH
ncbi:hypothetical protein JGB37_21270, partial [Salmonella enterica subsp. enterica serovar Typhimurium]|nr:hypothetical protein [Salmonella enterica subsp. enterica serovar Typhimurium]